MAKVSGGRTVRVAAAQFAIGTDLHANLQTCLHWLRAAGRCGPDLVVLPEFVNHASWYDDAAHCWEVSVELDGPFVAALAATAKEIDAYVVANCTVRRGDSACSGTSLLFSRRGELLATNDKQVLIGHENDFLRRSSEPGALVSTPIGALGLYACMDGVVSETPRCLALRGAEILCNSLNSFATDEGSLHIPVRAAENRVFVVAANKVGPLIPEALLDPVSAATGIPKRFLNGAGDSQIVAPDGTVLAIASSDRAEVIWADIELGAAREKRRPDGTDVFAARRPKLYAPIAEDPGRQTVPTSCGASEALVAAVQLPGTGTGSVEAAVAATKEAAARGARFIVLPELFFLQQPTHFSGASNIQSNDFDAASAALVSERVIAALTGACGESLVALSIVEGNAAGYALVAVLLDRSGVRLRQPLLHGAERHAWSKLGDGVATLELPDAHVAVLNGDDGIYPEVGRLLAMFGVDVLLVPCAPQEDWELRTGLVERAAENRINLVAACQPGARGTSLICSLQKDFTVLTPWAEREFDGLLSQPVLTRASHAPGTTIAPIHPAHAANKVVSRGTDLVRGRAWHLSEPIVADRSTRTWQP